MGPRCSDWILDTITGFSLVRFLKRTRGHITEINHTSNRLIKLTTEFIKRLSQSKLDRKHSFFLKELCMYIWWFSELLKPWNCDYYYSLNLHSESYATFQCNFHCLSAILTISSQANFKLTTIKILFSSFFHVTTF